MGILADGEWHELREFIALARKYVTPEYASRRLQRERRCDGLTEIDQIVARGRQYCVEERLRQMARRKALIIEGVDFQKRYKKAVT